MTAGDAQPGCTAFHSNARVVLASTPATHGTSVLMMCYYTDAPDTLLLERYDLATGALLDSVQLADRASTTAAPAAMCATSYDLFTLELDGTLRHYSRQTGNSAALLDGAVMYRALACTDSRLFAVDALTSVVLELDSADGLVVHVLLRLPAAVAMHVSADGVTLQLELGWPAAFVLSYDLQRSMIVSFSVVVTAVHVDDGTWNNGLCVLQTINAITGLRSSVYPPLDVGCQMLYGTTTAAVIAEGVGWRLRPDGSVQAIGGALLHNGNLGAPVAAVSTGANEVMVLDDSGRLARVLISTDACTTTLIARLPLLQRAQTVFSLSNWSALWMDIDGAVWVRSPLDSASVQLPPLGGAVFGGVLRNDGPSPSGVCILLSALVHCFALDNTRITETITLPDALSANIQQARLLDVDGVLMIAEAQQSSGGLALWYDGELRCELRIGHEPLQADTFVVLEREEDALAIRWSADTVRMVRAYNCSVDVHVVHASNSGARLSLLESSADARCLFGSKRTSTTRRPDLLVFRIMGVMCIVAAVLCCVFAVFSITGRLRAMRRADEPSGGWQQKQRTVPLEHGLACLQPLYGSQAQCCVHALCCCLPSVNTRIKAWQQQRRRSVVVDEPAFYSSHPMAESITPTAATQLRTAEQSVNNSGIMPYDEVHID
jgi:hypothetical protein